LSIAIVLCMSEANGRTAETLILQVGLRIRLWRHVRGWTLEHAAERAGMAVQNFARLERGRNLTLESIAKLAEVFGREPWELLAPVAALSPLDPLVAAGWRVTQSKDGVPAYDVWTAGGPSTGSPLGREVARLRPPTERRLRGDGWLLVRAVGGVMTPAAADGAWCLFRKPLSAPIVRKLVLVPSDETPGYGLRRVGAVEVAPDGTLNVRLDTLSGPEMPVVVRVAEERDLMVLGEWHGTVTLPSSGKR
jgi:transcriptional regulator with XRE-family HTH domain